MLTLERAKVNPGQARKASNKAKKASKASKGASKAKKAYSVKVITDCHGRQRKIIDVNSFQAEKVHIVIGNAKVGKHVMTFSFPTWYSCNHACECFTGTKEHRPACYAMQGCYNFLSVQFAHAENFKFFMEKTSREFCDAINAEIFRHRRTCDKYRWFTAGDILNARFLECMVTIAKENPGVKFWTYTKKYNIVNAWIAKNGLDAMPSNLTIIYSHWLNDDGSYFPMDNKYNLPTSEFIPYGREDLAEKVTFICPCSDPTVKANCENCDHCCADLKCGQSQALLEHSTKRTKSRDKAIAAAHAKL